MKKSTLVNFALVLAVLGVVAAGCDNRSQFEKDADKAAQKLGSALK